MQSKTLATVAELRAALRKPGPAFGAVQVFRGNTVFLELKKADVLNELKDASDEEPIGLAWQNREGVWIS